MLIYKATNIINNKSYIGLTTRTLQERKLEHLRHTKTENTYFHRAINEYGKDNFLWEIIDDTPSSIKELKDKYSLPSAFNYYYQIIYDEAEGYSIKPIKRIGWETRQFEGDDGPVVVREFVEEIF